MHLQSVLHQWSVWLAWKHFGVLRLVCQSPFQYLWLVFLQLSYIHYQVALSRSWGFVRCPRGNVFRDLFLKCTFKVYVNLNFVGGQISNLVSGLLFSLSLMQFLIKVEDFPFYPIFTLCDYVLYHQFVKAVAPSMRICNSLKVLDFPNPCPWAIDILTLSSGVFFNLGPLLKSSFDVTILFFCLVIGLCVSSLL